MKNLILILLIFLGIMFYSCKRNPTGPEDLQKNYKLSIVVFGNIIFNTDVYSQFNDLRPPPYGGHSESRYFEDVTIKNQNLDFVNLIQDTTKLPQIKYIKENAWGMDYYILSIHPTKKLIYIELFKYYGNNNDPSQGSTQTVKISVNSTPFIQKNDTLECLINKSNCSNYLKSFEYNYLSTYSSHYTYSSTRKSFLKYNILDDFYLKFIFVKNS